MKNKNKITNSLGNSQLDFSKNKEKCRMDQANTLNEQMINALNSSSNTDLKGINTGSARLDGDIDTI